jgi:hypothetical protein
LTRSLLACALAAASLALGGCTFDRRPLVIGQGKAERPAPPTSRKAIVDWANRYYAEPASVRYLAVTDPVRVRESVGQELWLVCVELDARERGGPYMGPRRVALGFGSGVFSAPLERSRLDLRNEDCDAPHFLWRPWSGPPRLTRISGRA